MRNQLVLLTGFLGAGKTTFMNHILREYEGARIGLVVNEFSRTGVDGALIRRDIPNTNMKELNNGSIFCACIKDDFVNSLVEMGVQGLEYVFVEASGLADPSSIASILDQIRTFRGVDYTYLGAVCLVDALNFVKHAKVLVSLRRQVLYSRAVIVNKTDLADEDGLARCEEAIREIRPDIPIFRTTYGQISLRELLSGQESQAPAPEESTNTAATRPVTVTLRTEETVSAGDLRTFLGAIAPSTYRIKGFCRTDEGTLEVSLVGETCRIEPWPEEAAETELVIISSVGVRIVSETLQAGKECFHQPFELR